MSIPLPPLPRPGSLGLIQYAGVDMLEYAAAVSAADNADIQKLYLDAVEQAAANADEVLRLRERIKVLEDALRTVAASHAWQLFGESRAFGTDRIPSPGQCHEIARAALEAKCLD